MVQNDGCKVSAEFVVRLILVERLDVNRPPSYFNIQQDDVAQQNMGDEQQNMDDEQQNVDDSNDFVGQQDLNMSTGSPIDIML